MKIVVGSTNPVKIKAVAAAFRKYFPSCEVVGVKVVSGVAEQPMSEEETRRGARARARAALAQTGENCDFGVGLEGGVTEFENVMYECAWACVVDKVGKEGLGGGLYFELPQEIAWRIRAGGELGPIMDELTSEKNVKQKSGAIGIFTRGELDRKTAYVHLVLQALIRFVSPEWFTEKDVVG